MSNKIALATIQFRADAKGANVALDSLRASADDARRTMKEMQAALDKGIKTMKGADGIEFDVATKFHNAEKAANSFERALRELNKGATALETVVSNIRLGEIEKSSRAELKGAINAVQSRLRSIREKEEKGQLNEEDLERQRDLNTVIVESQKQLNRLDRDTEKVIETLRNGGTVAESVLKKEQEGLEKILALIPKGTDEYKQYAAQLKDIQDYVTNIRKQEQTQAAALLGDTNLGRYSEEQIRAAISSARELIQTYKTADPEAQKLAKDIVAAEEYLKQYGVEAERAATKEAEALKKAEKQRTETNKLMEDQLRRNTGLTASALKQQEQYWQRLIDDPKAAAQEIAYYNEQLKKVKAIQEEQTASQVKAGGLNALKFFRGGTANASADELRDQAAALKRYRDSLPREDNAAIIAEINGYILKTGQVADDATQELMSLGAALDLAAKSGTNGFEATEEEIKNAMTKLSKSIEEQKRYMAEYKKNIGKGDFTKEGYETEKRYLKEYEDALRDLKMEQDNVGMSHKRMNEILKQPTSAENLEELRAAIKRAKAELNNMRGSLSGNKKEFESMAASVKKAEFQLKTMEAQAKGTASAFEKAWSRLKTYVTLYVGAAAAMQKLTSTMGDLMELSDKLGEVRKTTGFTADEVGRLSDNLKKFETRTTLNGLLELSAAAGQLGLKTQEDVLGFTKAANMLMVALPEMGKEGATEMLKVALATGEIDKIRKQMEQGLIEGSSATAVAMEKVGSTIDRLRASSAATAPAITDFVKRVGAVGAQSGISIDQVAALGGAVDALGMRVEMSATALSRMIPAIKNNAFAIGKIIGQTETEILDKFKTGQGMEVILNIFDAIRDNVNITADDIINNTENMNEAAETVEEMFGSSMKEVMSQLNQQGARAGIVFAGLSQNVDELRRLLGVASEAYEDNIAIQQEYDKMNDTTAAKWERFKNQLEEFFIGDRSQRALGWIIERLRDILDLLTGDNGISVALQSILLYLGLVKLNILGIVAGALTSLGNSLKNIGIMLGFIKGQMTALQWSNIFTALAAAIYFAGTKLEWFGTKIKYADMELVKADRAIKEATDKLDRMFDRLDKTQVALERATEATQHLKEGDDKLADAQDKVTIATQNHKKMIDTINGMYAGYLGYMLTEYDRAELIAAAHDKITASIKREMYVKQQQQSMSKLSDEYTPQLMDQWSSVRKQMREKGVDSKVISETFEQVQTIMDNTKINPNTGAFIIEPESFKELKETLGEEVVKATKGLDELVAQYMYKHLAGLTNLTVEDLADITGVVGLKDTGQGVVSSRGAESGFMTQGEISEDNVRQGLMNVFTEFIQKRDDMNDIYMNHINHWATEEKAKNLKFIEELQLKSENSIKTITTSKDTKEIDKAYEELAGALIGLDNALKNLDQNVDSAIITSIQALADKANQQTDSGLLSNARLKAQSIIARATANNNGNNNNNNNNNPRRNPYGSYKVMDPYEKWDADALVKRKKQMLQYVRALANGANVKEVLAQDKKFIDEATKKGIKDERQAIEWYNSERLKIQEELASRHLTNEGNWANPAKAKGRKKRQVYSEEAVAELDRYYAWRKEEIERQRAEEGISEAEYNRRVEVMEQEHLERRSKLRWTFTNNTTEAEKKEVEEFWKWWKSVKELDQDIDRELINAEWKVATAREKAYNNRDAQRDLTAMNALVVKQMKAIEDIINKERPFNGITENLEKNLTTMGILFADFNKKRKELLEKGDSTEEIDKLYGTDRAKRLTFVLEQSENAFTLTIEELMKRMADAGMQAWADEIKANPMMQQALLAEMRSTYDQIQNAIKKEASLIKKEVDIWWNDLMPGQDTSRKGGFEKILSQLGLAEDQVKRANSLIGAGHASERVADKLAIKQMQIRLQMQDTYYKRMRQIGEMRIKQLKDAAEMDRKDGKLEEARRKEQDAEHLTRSLNLSLSEEQKKLDEQRVAIANQLEESQNRLYTQLREWGDLLSSSVRELMEASNAGNAEYYNELAKLNLTGKGGPGAGTYVIIDNEGTSDATAHYEYLSEREALERQHEIERQNAQAEAWRKVMDDLNAKMNEQITDWINAQLQNQSIDANTDATLQNTAAVVGLTEQMQAQGSMTDMSGGTSAVTPANQGLTPDQVAEWTDALGDNPMLFWSEQSDIATQRMIDNMEATKNAQVKAGKTMSSSAQSTFAKMTAAANLYGLAYQTMSNDNMDASQKFQMFALQAAGNAAIGMLTTDLFKAEGDNMVQMPGILGKLLGQMPYPAAMATYAIVTALLGGLMGMAVSKVAKSKSQIAQVTGASGANAGRLTTGMLAYAEGNVNEFTDPSSLTPGRRYSVDAADGRTYRARYMGRNPRTHITSGPEFHLSGERGREMIIDAGTTRQITMNDGEIWRTIQTLSAGGRLSATRRRGRGVRAFADGNVEDFMETADGGGMMSDGMDLTAIQGSLDRNTAVQEALLERLNEPIVAQNIWHGPEGIPNMYNKMQKEAKRHGEKFV